MARSHYAGPGKGPESKAVKPGQPKGAMHQPTGKANPNPRGYTKPGTVKSRSVSPARVSVHKMVF